MGRYIDDILQPGEKVLYSTNAHWIFFCRRLRPGSWPRCSVLCRHGAGGAPAAAVPGAGAIVPLVALYRTVTAWFHRWTTETDVTNLRVVHKTGFITRRRSR
jgi:hypothetical protein